MTSRTITAFMLTGAVGGFWVVHEDRMPIDRARVEALALAAELGEQVVERSHVHSGVFYDIGLLGIMSDMCDSQDWIIDASGAHIARYPR